MSESERPQGERGARRAGRPALAPAALAEERAQSERVASRRTGPGPVGLARGLAVTLRTMTRRAA